MRTVLQLFVILFVLHVSVAEVPGVSDSEPRMIPQNYPSRCRKAPSTMNTVKPTGDGFAIKISGNPSKYQPNEQYDVKLHGLGSPQSKFAGFMLMVEPREIRNDISARPDVGSFQLGGNAVSKYSEECPNTIVNASKIFKPEIEVKWKAPPSGTGCVVFRAVVQENRDVWYHDEGKLVKMLCEEEQENQDEQPEIIDDCCACDEAKYELAFEGMWSRHTHPKNFPDYEWGTHFSDIIGVSHTNGFRMWEYGGKSSEGVKEIAEKGMTKSLEAELKSESSNIRTIIKTRGLWYPNTRGKTFAVFRVDKYNHLMSLLTKLAPSPDWIVGISALELCLKNCSWVQEKVMNLYPWDAGTDSGLTYTAPRQQTNPQDKIKRITSSTPNNPLSPFYDASGIPMKPVALLTITRQRVYDKDCRDYTEPTTAAEDSFSNDGSDTRKECRVSDWTEFQPCSVTCGNGVRIRTRTYFNKYKANLAQCTVPLVHQDTCQVPCPGNVSCHTTEWGEWSECSVTCGKGIQIRSRKYIDNNARKTCGLELMQKETCKGITPICDDDGSDEYDPECSVTHWSEWSPCTVTCGKGVTVRTRLYLNPESLNKCNVMLSQKYECTADKRNCAVSIIEAKRYCMKPKEIGPCRGYFPRWYYDVNQKRCIQFIYGGCRGNENNFERYKNCSEMCENLDKVSQMDLIPIPVTIPSTTASYSAEEVFYDNDDDDDADDEDDYKVNCEVSEWSEWSPCSATCGNAKKERRRVIKRQPKNGGLPCPSKLVLKRRCKDLPPCHLEVMANEEAHVDCQYSPWSEWTPCSRTCGDREIQQRTKTLLNQPRYSYNKCRPKIERKYCILTMCPSM